ncbi:phospholipase C [Paramuricea clavata]|uniref:Serine protease n=1 Tax=Paramuricea clavata TaxID=317549 RepID=A0A6S7LND3_PARCT|nr:phospholipase C [Paramuricea clavata]
MERRDKPQSIIGTDERQSSKSYARSITVTFPGEDRIEIGPEDLYAPPEFTQNGSEDHDYGLILLPGPGNCDEGFGWSTILADSDLNNRVVTVCGYPADKPDRTMWITGRKICRFTANKIFYETDTVGGESGSPAYTWYNGYWTVLGVHGYGAMRDGTNSAPRFTVQMITRFLQRMNCLDPKSLMSVQFPNVYIRCDGRGVVEPQAAGAACAGTGNCQYTPPSRWESYYIIPVEMRPSSAQEFVHTVALENAEFRNVYIRLDGAGMNSSQGPGGGVVNCQASVSAYESFVVQDVQNGSMSFRSVQFRNCYIRMDGRGVTYPVGPGGGTVNCQYYDNFRDVSSWESFLVQDLVSTN